MGKHGKLTKLKSALKKWPSFRKLDRTESGRCIATTNGGSEGGESASIDGNLHPVYVGKAQRRYLVSSEVIDHPVFQELANKTDGSDGKISVGCEVVLFDHFLWMLENGGSHLESMDELVELYSY
ncbi:auxin-responsive protein SAUR78-like [Cornus florida]|uniref:auxin-responsive protein SAUR78-like n=1 Tax=Cornus florida TaxID=4283 RepID=UPI0028A299FC|nr:auxin-responsive protein SAUR78-like [Cornus florida]